MKWARIENNIVKEIVDIDPIGRFHPDLVWVACGEEVIENYTYDAVSQTFSAPVVSLEVKKADKCKKVDEFKTDKLDAGKTYNGNPYQCCKDSQFEIMARFNYAVQSKADAVTFPWSGQPEHFDKWRDSNNVTQTFATPDDYIAFAKAINSHCNLIALKAMALKDSINACTSIAQVDAIDINTGWPGRDIRNMG